MAKYTGKVSRLFASKFGGSFKLEGHEEFFNTKNATPDWVQPGVTVTFEAGDIKGQGRKVTEGTLEKANVADIPAATSAAVSDRDQKSAYGYAVKDALEFVGILLANGAVKLPEQPSKKAAVLEALLDKYTASFFEDRNEFGALVRVEQSKLSEQEPAPKAAKAKPAAATTEEPSEEIEE